MVLIGILVTVLLMVPLITRATRPRPLSRRGLRWQGIDWERVKKTEEEEEDGEDEPPP